MIKTKDLLLNKRKGIVIIILLFTITIGLYLASTLFKKNSINLTSQNQLPTFKSVAVGSNVQDLSSRLGEPIKTTQRKTTTLLEYKSSSPAQNDSLITENGKVVFIREIITTSDKKNAKEITDKYGVVEKILYGPDSQSGFNLYTYPTTGLAYIGNSEGLLLEIWYFQPMAVKKFENKWAGEYKETLTPQQ